jgi:hypothetical protein
MNEFQATLTEALDISAFEGHARLAPGTYMVTLLRAARLTALGSCASALKASRRSG